MRIVDTRGEKCPRPIIETKKALRETALGEVFIVLTDSLTSFNNISRFLADNSIKFSYTHDSGTWKLEVRNEKGISSEAESEIYCDTGKEMPAYGSYLVAITSEYMGSGDNVLGRKLFRSFFDVLSCLDNLPSAIVFYNSGVKLAEKGSEICEVLNELENKGVEIIMCGTCIDHFSLEGKTCAGKTGDMYRIIEMMRESEKVIRP